MKLAWIILVVLLASATVYIAIIGAQKKALRDSERAQIEKTITETIEALKVPPEIVYRDYQASNQIHEIRRSAYQKNGVQGVFPYRGNFSYEGYPPDKTFSLRVSTSEPSEAPGNPADSTEGYFQGRANYACHTISNWFPKWSEQSKVGLYLREHPEIYKSEIRPRLILLADSTNFELAAEACKALLAAGENTAPWTSRLQEMYLDSHAYGIAYTLKELGQKLPVDPSLTALPPLPTNTMIHNDDQGQPLPPGATFRLGKVRAHGDVWMKPEDGPVSCPKILGQRGDTLFALSMGRIYRWDIKTRKLLPPLLPAGEVVCVAALSPRADLLATYGVREYRTDRGILQKTEDWVKLWDLTGKLITRTDNDEPWGYANTFAFDPYSDRLVLSGTSLCIWSVPQLQLRYRFPFTSYVETANLAFVGGGRDGAGFVTVEPEPKGLTFYSDVSSMRPRDVNPFIRARLFAVTNDYDPTKRPGAGNRLAAMCDRRMYVWDTSKWKKDWYGLSRKGCVPIRQFQIPRLMWATVMAWLSTADDLLVTADDTFMVLWDVDAGKPIGRLTGSGHVESIYCHGDTMYTGSADWTILAWDIPTIEKAKSRK